VFFKNYLFDNISTLYQRVVSSFAKFCVRLSNWLVFRNGFRSTCEIKLSSCKPRAWFRNKNAHNLTLDLNALRLSIMPIMFGITIALPLYLVPITSLWYGIVFLTQILAFSVLNGAGDLMRQEALLTSSCVLNRAEDELGRNKNELQEHNRINSHSKLSGDVCADYLFPSEKMMTSRFDTKTPAFQNAENNSSANPKHIKMCS